MWIYFWRIVCRSFVHLVTINGGEVYENITIIVVNTIVL